MEIITTVNEMQNRALQLREQGNTIGFVPTMGYLHDGHQCLMKKARKENDMVVASIFVNPLQFGPNEDFSNYPRDEERDKQKAEKEGVDILFFPTTEEMYPHEQSIIMQAVKRVDVLCGRSRKGHFDGVVTVLAKLFHVTLPNRVYFGLKDAQQVAVVDSLIKDYNFPVQLTAVPTVREEDGLAKSSRNVYLSEKERKEAAYLYQALQFGQSLIVDGEQNPAIIVEEVKRLVREHTSAEIDYVELLTYPDLSSMTQIDNQSILAAAIKFSRARLIDNIIMDKNGEVLTIQ